MDRKPAGRRRLPAGLLAAAIAAAAPPVRAGGPAADPNGVIFQAFEWYLPADGGHWNRLRTSLPDLAAAGVTALWLPPAYKGLGGAADVGYGVYDHYDLGEFQQKGTVRTKYGTRDEYLDLIRGAHAQGVRVYADVVMNHLLGADATEPVMAVEVNGSNRNETRGTSTTLDAHTRFTFPGRAGAYSAFTWNWSHFDGVDRNGRVYRFAFKGWDQGVDSENGNYDYLLGADLDFQNLAVRTQMNEWGAWYTATTDVDGWRLDAVKHIDSSFMRDWLDHVRAAVPGKADAFAVGEYWSGDVARLEAWLDKVNEGKVRASALDVALHYRLRDASDTMGTGAYPLNRLFEGTLVARRPDQAVTFVDNHDTQPLQALESPVRDWFKPAAYALVLLREGGYPLVFHGDYYGASYSDRGRDVVMTSFKDTLDTLMRARRHHAHGAQRDYFGNGDLVGFTREGTDAHRHGVAVVVSDNAGASAPTALWMKMGRWGRSKCFQDMLGAVPDRVCTPPDSDWAEFRTAPGKVSVWVEKGMFGRDR
ncbi:MAG TPA: alpha-amylase [Azospirillaceae bacterium]|nr:alpha-amylase [Azospirillaceae bacterium]